MSRPAKIWRRSQTGFYYATIHGKQERLSPDYAGLKGVRLPFLDEVVFLSAPDLDCQLNPAGMNHVCLVDRPGDHPLGPRPGILAGLINRQIPGVEPVSRTEIDVKVARALIRAMEQAGIRRSQKERRAGDYFLGELLADSPTYQDRVATHAAIEGLKRRGLAGLEQLLPWLLQWHNEPDPAYEGQKMGNYFRDVVLPDALQTQGLTINQCRSWRPPAPVRKPRQRKPRG